MVASFLVALLLGSITDVLNTIRHSLVVPQLAPVIILIPISAFFYAIRRHGLLQSTVKPQPAIRGRILNQANRATIYRYVTLAYVMGSFLSFILHYLIYRARLGPVLLFGAALFSIGLGIHFIQLTKLSEDRKDLLAALLVACSIPLITLRFIEFASVTVWAVPFIFVILSVLFSRRRMLILLTVFTLLTQVLVWSLAPTLEVEINGIDHLMRIAIFSMTLWLAFYVNSLYSRRLRENEDQISFQSMVSWISADFVTVNESNLDEKIQRLLQLSGEHCRVDRSYLFLFSRDQQTMRNSHEWCNIGIPPALDQLQEVPTNAVPWWMDQILDQGIVHIPDVSRLPAAAGEEQQILQAQGVRSLISLPVSNQGRVLGFIGFDSVRVARIWPDESLAALSILANIVADALVKVEAEREINYMAYYDQLTGLPNHTLFKDRLNQAIHLAQRSAKLIVVFFIDLDSFKAVNDTMGHLGGDELLKRVSERLQNRVRRYDTVSRFGGDEFLVMLPQIADPEDIRKVAANLMDAFRQPVQVGGQEFFITASAGVAVFPEDGADAETLIKNADLAMYAAKEQGKNRYLLCSPGMKADVLNRMRLTNSLYRALERRELVLHFQPQVNLVSRRIIGLEALIRWRHPELGMVSPGTFIPLAEQTGLINPIGEWVLRTACRQAKVWCDQGLRPLRMAVNLSVEQFRNPDLVRLVSDVLRETGLDPACLELEITESTASRSSDYITRVLNELKALGVSISIDDFGTEYSSLNRLKTLPIDRVKMAMQFVQGIGSGGKDEAIARVVIALARNLGLQVIAEGVETEGQLAFLDEQRCDEVQGYYFFRPLTAGDAELALHRQFGQTSVDCERAWRVFCCADK